MSVPVTLNYLYEYGELAKKSITDWNPLSFDNNIILNVETVDVAPLGMQNYQLIIEDQTPATTAFVSGTLVFSATAYSG